MEITPRFHELGSSKKNNNMIDFNTNKKSNSSEILEIYENENKCSEVKIHISNKTDFTSNDIICFLKAFNSNKKFLIRNDFDKNNSKKFLKDKFITLEKPILVDEIENLKF